MTFPNSKHTFSPLPPSSPVFTDRKSAIKTEVFNSIEVKEKPCLLPSFDTLGSLTPTRSLFKISTIDGSEAIMGWESPSLPCTPTRRTSKVPSDVDIYRVRKSFAVHVFDSNEDDHTLPLIRETVGQHAVPQSCPHFTVTHNGHLKSGGSFHRYFKQSKPLVEKICNELFKTVPKNILERIARAISGLFDDFMGVVGGLLSILGGFVLLFLLLRRLEGPTRRSQGWCYGLFNNPECLIPVGIVGVLCCFTFLPILLLYVTIF